MEEEIALLREVLTNLVAEEALLISGDFMQLTELYHTRSNLSQRIKAVRKKSKEEKNEKDPFYLGQIKVLRQKIAEQLKNNQRLRKYFRPDCEQPGAGAHL